LGEIAADLAVFLFSGHPLRHRVATARARINGFCPRSKWVAKRREKLSDSFKVYFELVMYGSTAAFLSLGETLINKQKEAHTRTKNKCMQNHADVEMRGLRADKIIIRFDSHSRDKISVFVSSSIRYQLSPSACE